MNAESEQTMICATGKGKLVAADCMIEWVRLNVKLKTALGGKFKSEKIPATKTKENKS